MPGQEFSMSKASPILSLLDLQGEQFRTAININKFSKV
jgi:hypothetical protein